MTKLARNLPLLLSLLIAGLCTPLVCAPTSRTPVVTAQGTTGDQDVGSLTLSGVTLKPGETLLVSTNDEGDDAKVKWNGIALHQDIATEDGNGCYTKIFSLYSASGGTGDIIATHTVADLSVNASSVTNLAPSALDKTAVGHGIGADPSSGATAVTTKADEFLWGAIGYASKDAVSGVWKDGFTSDGQFTFSGDTGGVENGFKIVSSTGRFTAAKSGGATDGWSALIATYAIAQ